MDCTTTINIDYYEELKRKADIYDNAKLFIDSIGAWNELILNRKPNGLPLPIISLEKFQELKRKADELDEKETPYSVTDAWVGGVDNGITVKNGRCKCGEFVSSNANWYCHKCGTRIDWTE